MLHKKCKQCNKVFYKKSNLSLDYWNKKRLYCSIKCQHKSLIGKSSWNKGLKGYMAGEKNNMWRGSFINFNCLYCKKDFKNFKSNHSKYCSRDCKIKGLTGRISPSRGRPVYKNRGSNHYFWKGGITTKNRKIRMSIQGRFWIKSCMQRDNYTCQKTGIKGGDLVVHHIKNFSEYPELRFVIDNGITLSKKAHVEFHRKYGSTGNNINQLKEFLRK